MSIRVTCLRRRVTGSVSTSFYLSPGLDCHMDWIITWIGLRVTCSSSDWVSVDELLPLTWIGLSRGLDCASRVRRVTGSVSTNFYRRLSTQFKWTRQTVEDLYSATSSQSAHFLPVSSSSSSTTSPPSPPPPPQPSIHYHHHHDLREVPTKWYLLF